MTRRTSSPSRRTPSQLGTVQQLPSGRWRAFYRRDGRRFSAPSTFATKTEANGWLASEFADRARGSWKDPSHGRVTLSEYANAWLESRPNLAPRTRDNYARGLRRWILPRIGQIDGSRGVELGAMNVADITPAAVRTWYAAIHRHAKASASQRLVQNGSRAAHPARSWAATAGLTVAVTGRLSPSVLAAWQEAGSPPAVPIPVQARPLETAGETTAAQSYRALHAILATAVLDGLLQTNPCQVKGAGQTAHRERGTATPAEVTRLSELMPPRFAAAVTLAAWSGLRYGELFALARRHINPETASVVVERALEQLPGKPISFKRPKTARSRRSVAIPSFAMEHLRLHLEQFADESPDALVFSMPDGRPVPSARISRDFRAARAQIGRDDLTWHDLRHTGATLAYKAGASTPEVMRRLGHTTMRAAMIYSHAADDSDSVLAQRLNDMFG